MDRLALALPSGRTLRAIDAGVVAWTLLWFGLAAFVAVELQGLTELSDTMGEVGRAAESSGAALALLGDVPLVGGVLDAPAEQIEEAGRSAQETGEASRRNIDALTALLAPAIALMPSLPILVLYLPARILRRREVEALEAARRRAGDDPRFAEFLARRAAHNLPYRRLSELTTEPWRELAEGRHDRLARAELERLGLRG